MSANPMFTAALDYAARGWRVLPLRPGSKVAMLKGWQDNASSDPTVIREWWKNAPTANVGILTGAASGIIVIDIDVSDGKQGEQSLDELVSTLGPLSSRYTVSTPSGGRHLYLRTPRGVELPSRTNYRPGIDIRAERGYVVAPPSVLTGIGQYEARTDA